MNREQSKEALTSLKEKFVDGERLSVEDIIKDYFDPKTTYSYLVAKTRVRGWLNGVKRHFKLNHGIWFGNLDDAGHYGIIDSEEEVRYAMIRYYRFIKGTLGGATLLVDDARRNGLLPEGMTRERILVAKLEEEDETD